MARCLVALGSNLGDRQRNIAAAVDALSQHPAVNDLSAASAISSQSVGGAPDQPTFLNTAATFQTRLEPTELLALLQSIEAQLGRQPAARWDARLIDVDLILYDDVSITTDQLTLPHPRFAFRRFVLEPAEQIAAEMIDPRTGLSIAELHRRLDHRPLWIAVVGAPASPEICEEAQSSEKSIDRRLTATWPANDEQPSLIVVVESAEQSFSDLKVRADSHQIPWLAVSESDPQWALHEIQAAFAAME